jgi:hypothetical protein
MTQSEIAAAIAAGREAEARIAAINKERRPTREEAAEALRAYLLAARAVTLSRCPGWRHDAESGTVEECGHGCEFVDLGSDGTPTVYRAAMERAHARDCGCEMGEASVAPGPEVLDVLVRTLTYVPPGSPLEADAIAAIRKARGES